MSRARVTTASLALIGCLSITALFSIASQAQNMLHSGDILLYDRQHIWRLNSNDYSQYLIVELEQEGLTIGGDVHVSPQHDYIYLTAANISNPEQFSLMRYRLIDGTLETVSDIDGLSRMSPLSLDGKWTVLMVSPGSNPSSIYYCLLEIATGKCAPTKQEVDINEPIWLSKDQLATRTSDGISLLHVSDGQLIEDGLISPDIAAKYPYPFQSAALMGSCCIVVTTQFPDNETYPPQLWSVNLKNREITELSLIISYYGARFNDVAVSEDGNYVSYQRSHRLEVQNLHTGELVATVDDVRFSLWFPDSKRLLLYIEKLNSAAEGFSESLAVLHLSNGYLETIKVLNSENANLWFEQVP